MDRQTSMIGERLGELTTTTTRPSAPLTTRQASAEAKARVEPKVGTQQEIVLSAIRRLGPLTDEEIIAATGLHLNSVRPRRGELKDRGLIEAVGEGLTAAGNRATKWGAVA